MQTTISKLRESAKAITSAMPSNVEDGQVLENHVKLLNQVITQLEQSGECIISADRKS